ncbi:hypothetical protein [Planctomicrobium sp. SH664]|uniref:hypothetical protein n=1 Tax=Planctomicrobium sp. SH664 TaxID=3448125 RepID=UPI003F5B3203
MELVVVGNFLEACLWFVLGIGTFLAGNVRGLTPFVRWLLVVSYFAFGLSDLIEIKTGAWYSPPALLVFKGLGLTGIAVGLRRLWNARRPGISEDRVTPLQRRRREHQLKVIRASTAEIRPTDKSSD